ncbi:hypothetical protein ABT294_32950 [Nonomuraea sp. NPDC000554]|uniref:hypothetical protein n=1 Tax=Nonomuraea sp. NPDC000554 TaxID=3154259 RepID=UPI0033204516
MDELPEAHHQDPELMESIDEIQEVIRARIRRLDPKTVLEFRAGPKGTDETGVWWWNAFQKSWQDNNHWTNIFAKSSNR